VSWLPAVALSINPGGSVRRVSIDGGLISHGAGITPLELHGKINFLQIADGLNVIGSATWSRGQLCDDEQGPCEGVN
jgi:hypothetical protein